DRMIAEAHCFEKFVKTAPDDNSIVYGEHLSKLESVDNESQLPYDLQLEKGFFTDLKVSTEEHKTTTHHSAMKSPSAEAPAYIQHIFALERLTEGVTQWIDHAINKALGNDIHNQHHHHASSSSGNTAVKAFAWHPQQQIMAVCNSNDIVLIYNFQQHGRAMMLSAPPLSLWMEFQVGVTDLQWKPNAPYTLAIATKNGVVIWEIDFNDIRSVPSNASKSNTNAIVLTYPYFAPTTLSWSSNGLQLASGSPGIHSVIVWDVASRVPTSIARHGGNAHISFSPHDQFLLSASHHNIRIFDTSKWDYNNKQWNFTSHHVGGHIRSIAISPDGNRLAVIFLKNRSTTNNDTLIALYRLKTTPNLSITPRGFLKKRNHPVQSISFVPNYTKGSLLSAVYNDGVITYFPLLYNTK
ncbi:hypothetical protein SAMD00019534_001980, partial [Acytostelium subglobosum LB1]|uniref:hypothetical protein n=1 Tax=Acytostelium subglobosum LB1 TaxID=1410327 RepID=UPI000644BF81